MPAAPPPSDRSSDDPFFAVYDRVQPAYGWQPSPELVALLTQCPPVGRGLDLGAGAGRDSLALAAAGLHVTSIDRSSRGAERLMQRAAELGLADRIEPQVADVREWVWPTELYQVIAATTVLDHLPTADALQVWDAMLGGLAVGGALYVEVHTTDDPGSPIGWGAGSGAPVSETAAQVVNYFPPGRLLQMAAECVALRVLRYEERLEWDYTHGPEHLHAKAVLLAAKSAEPLPWYGHPPAFPRR